MQSGKKKKCEAYELKKNVKVYFIADDMISIAGTENSKESTKKKNHTHKQTQKLKNY